MSVVVDDDHDDIAPPRIFGFQLFPHQVIDLSISGHRPMWSRVSVNMAG